MKKALESKQSKDTKKRKRSYADNSTGAKKGGESELVTKMTDEEEAKVAEQNVALTMRQK